MLNNIRLPSFVKNFAGNSSTTATILKTPLVITSTSNLALRVSGSANIAGNVVATNIRAGGITGNILTANQPFITALGFLGNLMAGNITVTGNLVVSGAIQSVATQNVNVENSVFELHTGAGGGTLTVDDGNDLGLIINYYKSGAARKAFLGWDNQTQRLQYITGATVSSGQITGTAGTIEAGSLILSDSTETSNTTSGALVVAGGAGFGGSIRTLAVYTDSLFYANGNPFTGIVGPAGAQGLVGGTGSTGSTGPAGPVGLVGATGASGIEGGPGPAGATGPRGPSGLQGATGTSGPAGSPGTPGAAGQTGATGPRGLQGNAGIAGGTGATGPQGPQGPLGSTGATGAQGVGGPLGGTGATGPQGPGRNVTVMNRAPQASEGAVGDIWYQTY